MVRSLLPPSSPSEAHSLIHQALIVPLVAAWIAAVIAIISFLCAKSSSKPSTRAPPPPLYDESVRKPNAESTTATTQVVLDQREQPSKKSPGEEKATVVELAPDAATHGPIPPAVVMKSTPSSSVKRKRKLSMSLSIRLHEKIIAKNSKKDKEEDEETIWKKAIILGEKCKVPSDGEEEAAAAACGGKLSRQPSYRSPATPSSRPVSRTTSFNNVHMNNYLTV